MEDLILPMLQLMTEKYPWAMTLVSFMGVMRLIFKPLFTFLVAVVKATPSEADDRWLETVQTSKAYNVIAFLLDYLASIKLPKAVLKPTESSAK